MTWNEDWTGSVRGMVDLDASTRERLRTQTVPVSAPAGAAIFREGSSCSSYLILLSGSVRVRKTGANGREIVLYRVEAGETCVVTTACLMANIDYDAEGIAETDIQARALPVGAFRSLLAESASFREFVFRAYGTRIADLLLVIEEVAFGRIEQRLASHLLNLGGKSGEMRGTHQDLAVELGTAREVVSRQLKEFERQGWVLMSRGSVRIVAPSALRTIAGK